MKAKLISVGQELALPIPNELARALALEPGENVELEVDPRSGAFTVDFGIRYFEGGRSTERFKQLAESVLEARTEVFRRLSKL